MDWSDHGTRPSPPAAPAPPLPPWAVPLLLCPACGAGRLDGSAGVACRTCGRSFSVVAGVVDLLVDPHPAVAREVEAVAALDRGEARLPPSSGPVARDDQAPPAEAAEHAFRRHVEFTLRQIDDLLARDPLEEGAVLVEIGADACQATPRFLAAGARVLAVDVTEHLGLARNDEAGDRLVRLRADMNSLPIHDGAADVVWATATAHHSWDLDNTFREAARVLRPAGRLVLCCEPMPGRLRWLAGRRVGAGERALGINETWIPRRRWLRLAREADFEARIEIPRLTDHEIQDRLAARGLPQWLAPAARRLLRPFQVSVHLVGRLGPDPGR